jgi:hypothetical protein
VAGAQDSSWSSLRLSSVCLATKLSHMGANVDGLACLLHHSMVYNWQMTVQSFLTGAALSRYAAVGGDAFPGGAKPLGRDI